MTRRDFVLGFAAVAGVSRARLLTAQTVAAAPDLSALASGSQLTLRNRTVSALIEGSRRGVRISAAPGEGDAFLPGTEFATGAIELDIRGKDVPSQSFVGVAFHGNGA